MASVKPSNPKIDWGNPITKGLVSDIPLFEGGGINVRDLVNNTNAVLVGDPTWVGGVLGKSVNFLNASDYLNLGLLKSFGSKMNNGVSVVCYVKSVDTAKGCLFGTFNTGSNTAIQVQTNTNSSDSLDSGKFRILIRAEGGGSLSGGTTNYTSPLWNDGNLHMLFFSFSPLINILGFSVDMIPQEITYVATGTPSSFANFGFDLVVANRNNRGVFDANMDGIISSFKIWNRIITPTEVKQLYTDPWCIYQKPRFRMGYQTVSTAIKDLISFGMLPFSR